MIHFELVTLDGVKLSEDVYEVILPTPQGYVGILPNHMPLVSIISPGIISVRRTEQEPDDLMELFATHGGVVEINGNNVRMLVDEADQEEEISEEEAQKAYERALEARRDAKDQVSLDHAQSLVDRQAVRLKVANIRRNRRSRP